jgi:hypothetical protein
MLVMPMRPSTVLALSLLLFACSQEPSSPPDSNSVEPSSEPPPVHVEEQAGNEEALVDPRFTDILLVAARDYPKWTRVDEHPNLAPVLCRAPMGLDYGFPSHARLSGADDAQHGKKLYFLYAGHGNHDARHYYTSLGNPGAQPIPVGFAIVKQSWTAVPSSPPAANAPPELPEGLEIAMSTNPPPPITWVDHEGQRLHTGEQAELFVMAKVGAADMAGTDAGWVYGTLTPDGKTVTSAGRVQRCMDCHDAAPHDRLFGLQKTKAFAKVRPSPWNERGELPPELGLEP